jgi:hypothetical protein
MFAICMLLVLWIWKIGLVISMATYQVHDVFGYKELHDVEALFYCSTENLLSCCLSSVFL